MLPLQGAASSSTLMLVFFVVANHVLQDCQAWMTPITTTTSWALYSPRQGCRRCSGGDSRDIRNPSLIYDPAPHRTAAVNHRAKQTTTVSCRMVAPQQLGMFEPLTLSSSSAASSASAAALLVDVQAEIQQEDRFVILEDLVSAPSTLSRDTASNGVVNGSSSNSDLWIPNMQQQQKPLLVPFHKGWDIQKELSLEHRQRLDRLRLHQSTGPSSVDVTRENLSLSPFLDKKTAAEWQEQQQQQHGTGGMLTEKAGQQQHERDIFRGGRDTILFVQHEPVYTLGSGSDESLILNNNNNHNRNDDHDNNDEPDIPIVRMNRGGEVTYHGPGMLVVYPVLDLRNYRKDIHWYMRALEEAVLLALQDVGIDNAVRDEETTGVWIRDSSNDDNAELYKVAAIGIHCRQWITQHGLAINVEKNPISERAFAGIVPCGLHGRKVGCVNQFLDEKHAITVEQMATSMVAALEEVFRIKLVKRPL